MKKNSLHDTGSSGTFVTHKTAREQGFQVVDALRLTINTMAEPVTQDTFLYRGKMFNFQKNRLEDILCHGASYIGLGKATNGEVMIAVDNLLLPYNKSAHHLGWCQEGEIDVLTS